MISDVDRAWLAGLYEGEGSAGIYGRGVAVYIAMTDADVLLRIQDLFPSPQGIRSRERRSGNKPLYEWRIRQRDLVTEFLGLVMPLLGERRKAQAQPVLARASDPLRGLGSGRGWKAKQRNALDASLCEPSP